MDIDKTVPVDLSVQEIQLVTSMLQAVNVDWSMYPETYLLFKMQQAAIDHERKYGVLGCASITFSERVQ